MNCLSLIAHFPAPPRHHFITEETEMSNSNCSCSFPGTAWHSRATHATFIEYCCVSTLCFFRYSITRACITDTIRIPQFNKYLLNFLFLHYSRYGALTCTVLHESIKVRTVYQTQYKKNKNQLAATYRSATYSSTSRCTCGFSMTTELWTQVYVAIQ